MNLFSVIRKGAFFDYWLHAGLLVFAGSFFLSPDDNVHKRIFYGLTVLPLLLMSVMCTTIFKNLSLRHYLGIASIFALGLPVLWSPDLSSETLIRVLRNTVYLIALLLAVNHVANRQPRFLEQFQGVIIAAAIIGGAILVTDLCMTTPDIRHATLVPSWRFDNQIRMANCFSIALLICVGWLLQAQSRARVTLATIGLITSIAIILLSRSKGATYALILTSLVAVTLLSPRSIHPKVFKRLIPACVVLAIALPVMAYQLGTIPEFLADGWSRRDVIWLSLVDTIKIHPLFGTGYLIEPRVLGGDGLTYWHEHNLFLAILRQSGIVGLAICVTGLVTLIISSLRQRSEQATLWVTLLIYGILAGLSNERYPLLAPSEEMWLWFWIPIAMLLALPRQTQTMLQDISTSASQSIK